MKTINILLTILLGIGSITYSVSSGNAQEIQGSSVSTILIKNVKVFDGESKKLKDGPVLIEGNLIKAVGLKAKASENVKIIDGGGGTLIPGLIDAHWHSMMSDIPLGVIMTANIGYLNHLAAIAASRTLARGFTTIRDVGGPVFGLKKAIDEKLIKGPRIYPSGAMISQTSGHGDFRAATAVPANPGTPLSYLEQEGYFALADGVPEVLRKTREILRQGASQIKVMAGGGVTSAYDPLDSTQYTYEELKAAVDAATGWNTYVAVHAYTPAALQMAVKAGVKSIEHGNLIDEETAKLIAKKGVWLCLQPFDADEDNSALSPESLKKLLTMVAGTDKAYKLARKYKIKTAWGTDTLFSSEEADRQGAKLAKLARWYKPWEVLKMATYDNAQLLKLSGPRNPYAFDLGVIKSNAFADLIIVDGNPLEDINLIADPDKNFVLIMKDGVIYKNMLTK